MFENHAEICFIFKLVGIDKNERRHRGDQGRSQVFIGGGGKLGQYKFINRNFSVESRKLVLLIFKPFKMSKKLFILA